MFRLIGALFLGILFFGHKSFCQTRVSLTFEDLTNVEMPLFINLPLKNGNFCNFHHVLARPQAGNGAIGLNVPLEKPGFLTFGINRKGQKHQLFTIYLEPRVPVLAKIDANDQISFSGRLREENEFILTLERTGFPHGLGMRHELRQTLEQLDEAQAMIDTLEARKGGELSRLDLLAGQSPKHYSEAFLELIRNDIHYYHLVVGAAAMEFRHSDLIYKGDRNKGLDLKMMMEVKFAFWDYLFRAENLEKNVSYSYWYNYFIYDYVMLYKTHFLREGGDDFEPFNHFRSALRNSAKLSREEARESFLAFTFLMFYEGFQESADLFEYYRTLTLDFPQSLTLDVIRPKAMEMEKIQRNSVNFKNDSIHVIANGKNISSMEELLERFRGKVVLMDIWASWCGPCLFEFEHRYGELQALQAGSPDFVILFVSRDNADSIWKKIVYLKNLRGYHIRPEARLEEHLRQQIQWNSIPRYVVFDKTGKIVSNPAPLPSEGNQLISIIKSELAK